MAVVSGAYITDIVSVVDVTMSVSLALPLQWKREHFETRDEDDALANATLAIVVKDPAKSTRVQYDADNLTNVSTGVYYYDFQVPENIVEGDWYVSISATIDSRTSIKNVHFEVREV